MPSDAPHDLHIFMSQITDEMAAEYARIYARSTQDPGTAGDEGEANWEHLLREWLPPNYHIVTKGRIIAHDKTMSPQIDVLVLKPWYPKKLMEKKIWLASGVAAAFGCKNTLSMQKIKSAANRCADFKRLYPPREGSPRHELQSPLIYGVLAYSHSWKGERSTPVENVSQAIEDAQQDVDHPRDELDLVCIADLATWSRTYMPRYDTNWLEASPKDAAIFKRMFGGRMGVTTAMLCAAFGSERQTEKFRPIGAMIAHLIRKMAFTDETLRDLADYYRLADLWGEGSGPMRFWSTDVYSTQTRIRIETGVLESNFWDNWSIVG